MTESSSISNENETLAEALRCALRGWRVLALHGVDEVGRCDCASAACASAGKHPRTVNGFKDATSDEALIRSWWERWPYANLGVAVGGESGLIVLDVDPRNGGSATIQDLEGRHLRLSQTLTTRTGGGGIHLFYKHPGVSVGKIGTGIDTKGGDPTKDNGYVVLPPSRHASGERYAWVDEKAVIAPFPTTLLDGRAWEPVRAPPVEPRIAKGERNMTLASLAGTMRRRALSEDAIAAALIETNRQQCDPPLAESEVRRIAVSIGKKEPAAEPRESQATQLVRLANEAEFWHAPEGDAYVTFAVRNANGEMHLETHAVRSAGIRRWLQHGFFNAHRRAPSAQAVQDALGVLEGRARFEGPEWSASVRVAEGAEGKAYVHLADPEWRAVEIGSGGWRVVSSTDLPPDVRFRRPAGLLALPAPVVGGDLGELRRFINVADDEQFALAIGWLVGALRPRGPYAVLNVTGEQGSAKSTAQRALKSLVDPSAAPLRSEPHDIRDVMIAAVNTWLPAFDNVSGLPPWFSDVLCRLATGGGFATRELYTDREEVIFEAMRPTMLNGIAQVVVRGDLADRMVMLTLPPIDQQRRMTEQEFWAAFDRARPRLLGALYSAVACALRDLPVTRLTQRPRMADFATWVVAAEPALPFARGTFITAYTGNRAAADQDVIEMSTVAQAIVALVAEGGFEGTATALLERLAVLASRDGGRDRAWPATAQHLSNAMRRLAPSLRNVGIDVDFCRVGRGRRRLVRVQARGAGGESVRGVRSVRADNAEAVAADAVAADAVAADAARIHRDADSVASVTAVTTDGVPEQLSADGAHGADAAARGSSNWSSGDRDFEGLFPALTREELKGDLADFPMLRALRDLDAGSGRWIDPEALA